MLTTGLLIFLPLIGALVTLISGNKAAKSVAIFFALAELGLSLFITQQFQRNADTQFLIDYWWIKDLGISFKAGIDGISLLMVLLTTVLTPLVISSSRSERYDRPALFYALLLFMQMALVGVFVSLDAFLFYIFWELALIPIYFICLLWGGERRNQVTFKFFVYTLLGSLIMLVGFIYLYYQTPVSHSFDIAAFYNLNLSKVAQGFVFWSIFIAFAIKMPIFPLHTWQPDTYSEAPAQGTMMLSGIMLKMGIYGVIRWLLPLVPLAVQEYGKLAIVLSVIGVVYASIIAIMQNDYKRLIAYSSIAHVGLIAAGIFTISVSAIQGAMIQMLSHGLNVIGLFYVIDIIESRSNTRMLSSLGGIRTSAPQLATMFLIILLGSVALPLTNGFVGEFMLLNGLFKYNAWIAALAGLSVILGAVYMLSSYQKSILGENGTAVLGFSDVNVGEKIVLAIICAGVLVFGIYPKAILQLSEPAVTHLVAFITAKFNV